MKKVIMLSLIALFTRPLYAQNIQAIAIGTALPHANTKMKSTNGKEFSIKDVMQKNGVLVMFSCNTCPYVIKYQARTLQAIKNAQENEIGVIIINSNETQRTGEDSYTAMQQYAKKQQYDVPYVVDENSVLANDFGATRTPECFLFNAKNELVYHGAIDDNQDASQVQRKHLATAIIETVGGKSVSVNNTRSVGCSIKRKE
jgi:thiol-disulfide isomerase/thioredoxin